MQSRRGKIKEEIKARTAHGFPYLICFEKLGLGSSITDTWYLGCPSIEFVSTKQLL
jgi:hypothetical protein